MPFWAANDADTMSTRYAEDASVIATKWKGTNCLGQPLELKQLSDDIVVLFSQGGAYQPGDEWVLGQNAIRPVSG